MSTSKHPQTDGATEITKRMFKIIFVAIILTIGMTGIKLLPAAEFRYNSAVTEDLVISTFKMDLRWRPKSPLDMPS